MELRDKKFIKNTLPKFGQGLDWGGIATGAAGAIGSTIKSFTYDGQTKNDMLATSNKSTSYVNGIGYDTYSPNAAYNDMVKEQRAKNTSSAIDLATLYGTTLGKINPWLGAIGAVGGFGVGLISGNKKNQLFNTEMSRYSDWLRSMNQYGHNKGISMGTVLNNMERYGDPHNSYLWSYKCGKNMNKYSDGKHGNIIEPVLSPSGVTLNFANSFVEPKERGWRPSTGEIFEFSNGKNERHQGDVIPANLLNQDVVFTDRKMNPEMPSLTFAQSVPYYSRINELPRLANLQAFVSKNGVNKKGLPRFSNSKQGGYINPPDWKSNAIPAILGLGSAIGLYIDVANQTVYSPHTYRANAFLPKGLQTLAGLQINPDPIVKSMKDSEFATNEAIDMSSGLTHAQRWKSRLRALAGTQKNIANTLANIQFQNNAYKSDYAKESIRGGEYDRNAAMSADQHDSGIYLSGLANKNNMKSKYLANVNDIVQNYFANEYKRKHEYDILSLYQDQNDLNWYEIMHNNPTKKNDSDELPTKYNGMFRIGNMWYDNKGREIGGFA